MSVAGTFSLLGGETLLSLYPMFIKTVNADMFIHTMVRVVTFAVVSYWMTTFRSFASFLTTQNNLVSLLNLFHIYSSYVGFRKLDVGVSLSIFYLYPIINVIIKNIIKGKMEITVLLIFIQSLVGVYLIGNQGIGCNIMKLDRKFLIGAFAVLMAAISESIIYMFYKQDVGETNPFNMLFTLSFFGSIVMVVTYILTKGLTRETYLLPNDWSIWMKLIAGNLLFGVMGHLMRFYGLSRISVEWFSILSFFEVIIGYLLGWWVLNEKITRWHIGGTSIIFVSIYQIYCLGYN
jgi:drug/metabolite transporter (DMT)-like permease